LQLVLKGHMAIHPGLWRIAGRSICLTICLSALCATHAPAQTSTAQASPNALLAVDQNRATVIERIVSEWGAALAKTNAGIDVAQLRRVVNEFQATPVAPDDIYASHADIFAPCAFGGVVNETTIPQLKAEIIVGSANNQLCSDADGDALAALGILYAPDCVANSGGIINGCRELLGWDLAKAEIKIDNIYDRTLAILEMAAQEHLPPFKTAERLARRIIQAGRPSDLEANITTR